MAMYINQLTAKGWKMTPRADREPFGPDIFTDEQGRLFTLTAGVHLDHILRSIPGEIKIRCRRVGAVDLNGDQIYEDPYAIVFVVKDAEIAEPVIVS